MIQMGYILVLDGQSVWARKGHVEGTPHNFVVFIFYNLYNMILCGNNNDKKINIFIINQLNYSNIKIYQFIIIHSLINNKKYLYNT